MNNLQMQSSFSDIDLIDTCSALQDRWTSKSLINREDLSVRDNTNTLKAAIYGLAVGDLQR